MNYLFCGIDVSKDKLDYALCHSSKKDILEVSDTSNSVPGIRKLLKTLIKQSKDNPLWVCLEHTGHYGLLLIHMLTEAGIAFSVVSSLEIIKSNGLTRGKSDPIDAQRIAQYAATFQHRLTPYKLPSKSMLQLRSLLTTRDQQVRMRTQAKNALKALKYPATMVDLKQQIREYQSLIKRFDKNIANTEKQMLEIVESESDLKQTYDKVTRIIGVGQITTIAVMLATNNFTSFDNPRKFSCYCGLAPFEHSSGTSVRKRTKTSMLRNKELKKLMFNVASSAIAHDQQIKTYYNRKIGEGKAKLSVINAVACKMVYRIFAVARRDTPYVEFKV